jgi:hypothetical protein
MVDHKSMVDHDQQGVKARGRGKVGDKITRDLLEGTGGGGFDRGERRDNQVGICLALLAKGTTFDVFTNEVGKTRPPVFGSNKLVGFKITRMAGRGVIMRMSDDVAAKRTRVRDIDLILVGKEAPVNLPIREARTEGRENGAIEGLEGILHKDIITRSGGNEITQGSIDDPNEERWGKEGHIFIVRGDGEFIRLVRQGVRPSKCRSRDMSDFKVEVSEIKKPVSLTTVQILGAMKEGEVFVICKALDRERGSVKVLAPGFKGADDCK